jgi:Acyl-CoA reductase (LuxC)
MTLKERISTLVALGGYLSHPDEAWERVVHTAYIHNKWFTHENTNQAAKAIAEQLLSRTALENWCAAYNLPDTAPALPKSVGIVMAGNLPLVGFHDFLAVFITGNQVRVKLSDKDQYLLPFLVRKMIEFNSKVADLIYIGDNIKGFDAVIATGSNNSARYFEAYFKKFPHIIRRNRNGVGVLDGNETEADFAALGEDIFSYFGLGCRNVAKIYVPRGYHFDPLMQALHSFNQIVLHDKYKNNFDYNYALFLLNLVDFKANGCIMITEEASFLSRIGMLHYEYYDDIATLEQTLIEKADQIQCIVKRTPFATIKTLPFGQTQHPTLMDYPDGVDTMAFLIAQ